MPVIGGVDGLPTDGVGGCNRNCPPEATVPEEPHSGGRYPVFEMAGDAVFLPVQAAYDRWSSFYDAYDNPMVFMAGHALAAGLAKIVAGKSVFEFGCGTGRNLAALKAAGASRVAGCDFSEGMLTVARRRPELASEAVFVHDVERPLPPTAAAGEFDAVLFCLTLEHVERLAAPLGEAARILRAGGEVRILEIHPYFSFSGVAAHFQDGAELVTMPAYPHQFAGYLNALAEAGLQVASCREWRPRDVGEVPAETGAPRKAMKRGPDFPLLVEFSATRRYARP